MKASWGRVRLGVIALLGVAAFAVAVSAMSQDPAGVLVFGQPDFVSNDTYEHLNPMTGNPIPFADLMWNPYGVAVDASVTPNRLYVTDTFWSRVLGYKDVATYMNGAPADLVIGQPDFVSGTCNNGDGFGTTSASTLCQPGGVVVDAGGNLYVADGTNSRVVEFNTPFAGCASFPCVGIRQSGVRYVRRLYWERLRHQTRSRQPVRNGRACV